MAETSHDPYTIQDWATTLPCRRRELRRAGFNRRLVGEIASDLRYDLCAVLALVDRGCPPALAARILAPLEANDR